MLRGGASVRGSIDALPVRATMVHASLVLRSPPATVSNLTNTPFSRWTYVPPVGTGIPSSPPPAPSRSYHKLPFSRMTRPAWSQRRTQHRFVGDDRANV